METIDILERTFHKCSFSKQKPSSYINYHTRKGDEEIILVTKKKYKQNCNVKPNADSPQSETFDLTGSPLKLELSVNLEDTLVTNIPKLWTEEEAIHEPVEINEARNILNRYINLSKENNESQSTSMWIVTASDDKTLLLTVKPSENEFDRGIISYVGDFNEINIQKSVEDYAKSARIDCDKVKCELECEYIISGVMQRNRSHCEDLLFGHSIGGTNLLCKWNSCDLEVPLRNASFELLQEVVVGHSMSNCNSIWRSITSFYSLNQILVDVAATARTNIDIGDMLIRQPTAMEMYTQEENESRLSELLQSLEINSYMFQPSNHEECLHLGQVLQSLATSTDFTYALWDILRDSATVEDILKLLMQALVVAAAGKFKPVIHPQNKTQLSRLVLNLSRGHPQASKLLTTLKNNPTQALSLLAQVANDKLCWEFNKLFTKIDHSFNAESILAAKTVTQEGIDQLNQSLHDMTMGAGDTTSFNPFQRSNLNETSIRISTDISILDSSKLGVNQLNQSMHDMTVGTGDTTSFNPFQRSNLNETSIRISTDISILDSSKLGVSEFASLKKSGLATSLDNQVQSGDELDVGRWKGDLRTFAQMFLCLEHLVRAQQALRLDFSSLATIWSALRSQILADKSPIRGVGQLINDPLHAFKTSLRSNLVADHVKNKMAIWYNIRFSLIEEKKTKICERRVLSYLFSQQSVFPPSIWQDDELETPSLDVNKTVGFYCTKYLDICTKLPATL